MHKASAVRDAVARELELSDADLQERLKSGDKLFANRATWATIHLAHAGLIRREETGWYRITDRGRAALSAGLGEITYAYLIQFPEYREYRYLSNKGAYRSRAT